MNIFRRTDTSMVSDWWWTVDRWLLFTILALLVVGLVMTVTASAPEAARMALGEFHFAKRQGLYIIIGLALLLAVSFADRSNVRRLALIIFAASLLLVVATLIMGPVRNGAQRWLSIAGMSIQPSEILKPAFVVLSAWLLSRRLYEPHFPAIRWSLLLLALCIIPMALQPDIGQASLLVAVWIGQVFLVGAPIAGLAMLGLLGIAGLAIAYFSLPYIAERIQAFIEPVTGMGPTQSSMALDAFRYGGMFGRGPSEGEVKLHLPDAYADYIFAVIGEEFGLAACLILMLLFAAIVIRGLARLLDEEDPFALLAVAGLLGLFGLQAFVNMGVNVGLLPPKGMTLPFVSYGGSSMFALCVLMGFLLALTRRSRLIKSSLLLPGRYVS